MGMDVVDVYIDATPANGKSGIVDASRMRIARVPAHLSLAFDHSEPLIYSPGENVNTIILFCSCNHFTNSAMLFSEAQPESFTELVSQQPQVAEALLELIVRSPACESWSSQQRISVVEDS